ncbi:TRAP transporter large permease [Oceanobacillus profundus]|uniref:TRAP transporter large permease n=1 Tax=Oceanobacillus profundus TaxID=372463 RepID=A0A417Y9V6_9BACI|nr:TRAP transporter large permease [Oceanobacillus profundus]PAE30242.1 C4-dicarboxylate ABC transporter permease [Paenibacillus sp. 7884-2]RHW29365.1 TRAP transporter large permease [Oceanobacillus profundus]
MAALLFSSLIGLLLLNVPLAIAVGLASILVLYIGDLDLFVAVQRMITGLDVFSLMAIPLFMIAGKIMEIGGISKRLVDLAASIVGSITGGFAIIAVISSMFFAAISGSAPATVVAIGSILVPAMIKEGYDKKFSIALIAASGTIGIIIPPSIPFITFGISANASVGDLFIAGVLPGLLMGLTLIIYCFIISKRKGYKGSEKTSIKKFFQSLKSSILGLLMPLIILGGIYLGWFTPTESGAVACIYGLIVSLFIYRTMKISELKSVFVEAGTLSAMVLFIVATANLMSWLITVEQIPSKIAGALSSVTESPLVFLFIITLVLLVVGTFMETNAAIILIVPILLPLLNTYDINLIHFGVLMIFNLAIGLLTPPLGVNLFVAKSLANIQFNQLIKSIIPFILLMLLNLVILIIIPEISLLLLSE